MGLLTYMKILRHAAISLMAVAGPLSVLFVAKCLAADAVTNAEVPTGLYVSVIDVAPLTVRLGTNGNYEVRSERSTQRGTWKWDARRQEFLLAPTTNGVAFPYEFRRLRRDPRDPSMLQWLPLHGDGAGPGVIDYVRFKRQGE